MSHPQGPGFTGSTPIFCVDNVAASLEFYVQKLGFVVAWQWSDTDAFEGGAPTFACVCRGEMSLFLGEKRQGHPGSWLMVHLRDRQEMAALHAEWVSRGAPIVDPPEDRPWGMHEMVVQDLDGNTFRVGAPVEP